jgi:hypothetical protein
MRALNDYCVGPAAVDLTFVAPADYVFLELAAVEAGRAWLRTRTYADQGDSSPAWRRLVNGVMRLLGQLRSTRRLQA